MSLISKLKSILGLESNRTPHSRDVGVTVERESPPKTEAEPDRSAVADAQAVAPETGTSASAESVVEESVEETDEAEVEELVEEAEESEAEESVEEESETVASPDETGASVEVIKGVGPAYADRLRDAEVEDTVDLAAADAEDLADKLDLSPKRVGRWIDRAQNHENETEE